MYRNDSTTPPTRNIEDTAYKSFAFDASTFRKTTVNFVGEPRTFGLTFSAAF